LAQDVTLRHSTRGQWHTKKEWPKLPPGDMAKKPLLSILLGTLVVIVAVTVWSTVLDTNMHRRLASQRIQRMVEQAKVSPDDPEHAHRLLALAKGTYSFEACSATVALGDIGIAAKPVVYELGTLMESSDPYVAREAARSLGKLGPIAKPALPLLIRQVETGDPDDDTTWFAAEAIGRVDPTAVELLPLLRSKLGTGTDNYDWNLKRSIEVLEDTQANQREV